MRNEFNCGCAAPLLSSRVAVYQLLNSTIYFPFSFSNKDTTSNSKGSETEEQKCCYDCARWRGRCDLERVSMHLARDSACEKFKPKTGKFEPICDFLRYTR